MTVIREVEKLKRQFDAVALQRFNLCKRLKKSERTVSALQMDLAEAFVESDRLEKEIVDISGILYVPMEIEDQD